MYLTPYTPTAGKTPVIRTFTGNLYDSLQMQRTFKKQDGENGKWVEVDILPMILGTELEKDGKIESFVFTYRYYDSVTVETKK